MPYFQHKNANLYYEVHGTAGDAVLMIQGVGAGGNAWLPQVNELKKTHRVVFFDNRGYGRSSVSSKEPLTIEQMAEDAKTLMTNLKLDSFHVIGHSMGGVIAQRLALTHPKAVKSLVLMCTVSKGADAVKMTGKILVLGLRTRIGTKAMRRAAFLELIYPEKFLQTANSGELATSLAPLFGRDLADNPPVILKQAMALKKHDCTAELAKLGTIPTIVISAVFDLIAPVAHGKALAAAIPGAKFVEIKEAAHGVPIHRATEVNQLVAKFLADISL